MTRLRDLIDAWRPRQILRTRKHVSDLVAARSAVGEALARRDAAIETVATDVRQLLSAVEDITSHLGRLQESLAAVERDVGVLRHREAQDRVVLAAEARTAPERAALERLLADEAPIAAHVHAAIATAPVRVEPFPHLVVDDLLPKPVYASLLKGLPPVELFADRPVNERQMGVPFRTPAQSYGAVAWHFAARRLARHIVPPAVVAALRDPINAWLATEFPAVRPTLDDLGLRATDGRILLRGAGYEIPPHRDPRWSFLTCLVYLARKGDDPAWGTTLYAVSEDEGPTAASPYWIDAARCHSAVDVEFRPNRALIFLNSIGAHGAVIPADAPADTERYAYQFRIVPDHDVLTRLVASLPPDKQPTWQRSAD